jgi:hypothetical protein
VRRSLILGLSLPLVIAVVMTAFAAEASAQRRQRPGRLTVMTTVEGAEVLVDEESVGTTPLAEPIELPPGQHTVRVRRPGYTEFTDVARIQPNQTTEIMADLMALAMVLTVRTMPEEARVFVDGTFRGTTPTEVELIEGAHTIRITHPTHRETTREITAVPGQTELIDVELEPIPEAELRAATTTEWFEDPIVWIGIGSGAVALAVIIVLIAVLAPQSSQLDEYCGGDAGNDCIRIVPDWRF